MRTLQIRKKIQWLLAFVMVLYVFEDTRADFLFGDPQDLGLGTGAHVSLSADELELYFASVRTVLGYEDLWVSTRRTVDDPWGPPTNLETVNSPYREAFPSVSPDGLTLYFSDYFYGPDRPGGLGGHDLWMSTRISRNHPWGTPVNMGAPINSSSHDVSTTISHDALTFIFASDRSGGSGGHDLWMCTRLSVRDAWDPPTNLGPIINSSSNDYYGNLSPDGLVLFFESNRGGTYGGWMAMRRTVNDPWEPPVQLPAPLHSMGVGCISADGAMFYAGMSKVPIVPIVDFNGDGIIDAGDMCNIIDHWGENYSLYDIGPMPWGDGIVDVQDLIILAEHLFKDVSDTTLIAHWPLDEVQGDIAFDSAADCDGTLMGGLVWRPEGGIVDGALQFDGIDDYVSTNYILNPGDGMFSVITWIKGGAPGQVILSQIGAANWLCIDPSAGTLMTELTKTGRGSSSLGSEAIIADGNWHRIAFVWDGLYRRLYVDGVVVAEDAQDNLDISSNGLYFGTGKVMESDTFFSGLIDDIRIYNRVVSP